MVSAKPSVLAKFQLRLLLVVQLEHQIQIPLTLMKPGVDSELYHSHTSLFFTCYLPKFALHFYLFLSRCMSESLVVFCILHCCCASPQYWLHFTNEGSDPYI